MEAEEPTKGADPLERFGAWAAVAVLVAAIGWPLYGLIRDLPGTAAELAAFSWPIYIPVLLLTLVNYGLRFFKWHYLLLKLDIRVPLSMDAWIFTTGLAMVITPGKIGELAKPMLVKRITGAPLTQTVPALVAERATDGIAVVVLCAIGVSTFYAEGTTLIYSTLAVCLIGILALAYEPAVMAVIRILHKVPLVNRVSARIEEAYRAMRVCLAPVPLIVTVIASIVAWWAECLGYYLVFYGMSVQAGLDVSTFLYAFATVFGAPMPGGMGAADLALAEGALRLLPGLTEGQALASSFLIRIATLWFGVGLGSIALVRMLWLIRQPTTSSTEAPS